MRLSGKHKTVYELTTLPGCSQVVVSHGLFMAEENRGKGFALEASLDRLLCMNMLGYDLAICTVDMGNTPQVKTLYKSGWTLAVTFNSSRTGHDVGLFFHQTKELSHDIPEHS